jgi:hypothetical protein
MVLNDITTVAPVALLTIVALWALTVSSRELWEANKVQLMELLSDAAYGVSEMIKKRQGGKKWS